MMRYYGLILLLVLGLAPSAWGAPSKQYVSPGTPVTYCDSGCSHVLALQNLTTLTGKYGDRHDKGASSQPAQWGWSCSFTLVGTKVPGAALEVWVSWSDGTNADGALGTTAGTLANADKRRNLKLLGQTVADTSDATTGTVLTASGMAWLPTRYFSPAVWNATTLPTQNVANTSSCTFTPLPNEMQ